MSSTAVLVVEDERIISKAIQKQLAEMGYVVAGSTASGEEAVGLAASLHPDVVLMDIHLGGAGIDGVEAADRIRRADGPPVVFLTAHSDPATLERAKVTGPHGYVLKPYEARNLQTAVEVAAYKGKLDRRLRENEQWLAATLGSIGDGVIATDGAGRVRFLNAVAERLTGWTQADAAGRDVREVFRIVHERTRESVANPALEALERRESVTLPADTVLVARDGTERPVDDSAAPITDVSGGLAGAVLVFRDVSERRRLEEHLRQAAKMEAVGRLAGGIAHDFNNIMTVVTGYTGLLRADDLSAGTREEYLGLIHDAGQRAAGLTRQILAFSRRQVLAPVVLDLNACVRDVAGMVGRLVGDRVDLGTHLARDLGRVKADPTQVGQVLLNLIVNARDAMPRGGRLTITTANADLGPPTTRDHPDVAPGRYAMVAVADTGTGIPPDVLPHVFEPFYTTKGAGQGTGLGLATVHGIVKQSGGHVAVESEVDRGTTFRVYLPLVEEPASAAPAAVPGAAPRGTETVLVVEDEGAVRRLLVMVLRRLGYAVLEAADGQAGQAAAEAHAGPVHLLLTDLVMPRMGGRELAEKVVAAHPDAKVLFMSGYTEDELVHQGVASASVEIILKPFTPDALTRRLRAVLDRGKGDPSDIPTSTSGPGSEV